MYEHIACIGGATLDRKLAPVGELRPGTSNPVTSETSSGGAARNVAEALARLGCPVALCSRVGEDAGGELVADELRSLDVDLTGLDRVASSPTASYTAVLDEAGELVYGLADMEIFEGLDGDWAEERMAELRRRQLWVVDANLPAEVLERLVRRAAAETRIYADPVSVAKSRRLAPVLDRIHTIFPDRPEAAALCGAEPAAAPDELAAGILELGLRRVVITLGEHGVWIADPPRHERVPAVEVSAAVNVNGAGDCFLAGFVFAETAAAAIDPVRCGLAAAALAVESPRAVPPELTAERLLERYRSSG